MKWRAALAVIAGLSGAASALAHDAPYSFLDLRLAAGEANGTLTAHVFDLAHELGWANPDSLLDSTCTSRNADRLAGILAPRLQIRADGRALALRFGGASIDRLRKGVTLRFSAPLPRWPGGVEVQARLFPYDAEHETYLNVYEGGSLELQTLLDRRQDSARLFTGTRQGRLAVIGTFLIAGVQHIFLGPDHVLFVIGLLLLGGGIGRLLKVVTAFTTAHSVTLALATLRLVDPPARVIEPLIAASIVLVGFDNLRAVPGHDHRVALAFLFGLVHGFGFASVLRDLGLPPSARGWSLFSFNLGVEVGQAVIVISVAPLLALARGLSPRLATGVLRHGSVVVVLAGAYWLGERLLLATR